MTGQELVQDAFAEDIPDVMMSIKQQLQHGSDGDEAVMGPVGSDDACSDQVNLIQWRNLNGIDEVLISKLWMEVDGAGGEAGVLSSSSAATRSAQLVGASPDGTATVVASSGGMQTGVKWHTGHGGRRHSHRWQGPHRAPLAELA